MSADGPGVYNWRPDGDAIWFRPDVAEIILLMGAEGPLPKGIHVDTLHEPWLEARGLGRRHPVSGWLFLHPFEQHAINHLCLFVRRERSRLMAQGVVTEFPGFPVLERATHSIHRRGVECARRARIDEEFRAALHLLLDTTDIFGLAAYLDAVAATPQREGG